MNKKPRNPYTDLLEEAKQYVRKVLHPRKVFMTRIPKNGIDQRSGYRMDDIYQKVCAAEDLGYDVQLFAVEGSLEFKYVEKPPRDPFWWR